MNKNFNISPIITIFFLLFLSYMQTSSSSNFLSKATLQSSEKASLDNSTLRIAFCLTGQLTRLEIYSKIDNIIIPNVLMGNTVHFFINLDNEVRKIKQTYWRYNYSYNLYGVYEKKPDSLEKLINSYACKKLNVSLQNDHNSTNKSYDTSSGNDTCIDRLKGLYKTFVRLSPPSRKTFHVIQGKVLVSDKKGPSTARNLSNFFEKATVRFQNNLRWMNGLRDCVKLMQKQEYLHQKHYDVVVCIRDDSYILNPWIITNAFKGKLTALRSNSFSGINDHVLSVDRKYADILFRGLIEDYYFKNSDLLFWGNLDHHITMLINQYRIPVQRLSICEQPFIPLRGLVNDSYWRLHSLYIKTNIDQCNRINSLRNGMSTVEKNSSQDQVRVESSRKLYVYDENNKIIFNYNDKHISSVEEVKSYPKTCCDERWIQMLKSQMAPVETSSDYSMTL